jgi:hypothetical protein
MWRLESESFEFRLSHRRCGKFGLKLPLGAEAQGIIWRLVGTTEVVPFQKCLKPVEEFSNALNRSRSFPPSLKRIVFLPHVKPVLM